MKSNTNPKCPDCGTPGHKHDKRGNKTRYRCPSQSCSRGKFVENAKTVGRPAVQGKAMTAAERKRRQREKEKRDSDENHK